MKRKTVGALTLAMKKSKKNALSARYFFWGNYPLIHELLLPFLDEWGTFNLGRVDRVLSQILRDNRFVHNRLSLVSQHFEKLGLCCICFGPTCSRFSDENGLYCHINCIPKVYEWSISNTNIPGPRGNNDMGTFVRGFREKNICFNDQNKTLSYFIEKRDIFVYDTMFKKDTVCMETCYSDYFKEFYKKEDILRGYDTTKKVNFGGVRISVETIFNHLYPMFYSTHDARDIIERFKNVEIRIKRVHDLLRIHFSTHIRPKLLEATSWGKFMCTHVLFFTKNTTFINAIMLLGVISSPDKMIQKMNDSVNTVREHQIYSVCKRNVISYFSKHRLYVS